MSLRIKETGKVLPTRKDAIASATVISIGEPVSISAGKVIAGASGTTVWGIALQASANGSTDPIEWQPLRKSDIIEIDVGAGTPAATTAGSLVDIYASDNTQVDLDTSTNDDYMVVGYNADNSGIIYVVLNASIF